MSDSLGIAESSSFNQSTAPNQTKADGSTRCDQIDFSADPLFTIVYSLVFLVGFFLNGFIVTFYFCQAQHSSSSIVVYLKNLAASDFLLCLCLPIRITKYASSSATLRMVYCNFGVSAFYLNMYASILFMGYIAANRYLKIVHPLGTHMLQRVRAAYIICTVTWVCLLALVIAYTILSFHSQEPLTSIADTVVCEVLHSGQLSILYKIVHSCSTAIFLFVLVSLVFFYYSTCRRVLLVQQRRPVSSNCNRLAKSHMNMLVLVTVFCICFVPYHLVYLPSIFLWKKCSWSKVFYYLTEVTILVSVLNVCLDPLIYFIFCKAFRTQFNLRVLWTTV